jgi:enoyl-CoA hydratase/carnithine racemase
MTIRRQNIILEEKGSIGVLTIDNPPQNYLLQPDFVTPDDLRSWVEGKGLKGMILCGAGRHFSAGASLEELFRMAKDVGDMAERLDKGKEVLDYLEDLDIPVFAVISGVCFGAGLEIALAAHARICSQNALFAFPETNQGLMPGLGGTLRLPQRTSGLKSARLILGGDMIDAAEALEMKIVDHVVDSDPTAFALTLLNKMTGDRSLKVIRYVMRALSNARRMPFAEAMKEETRMFCDLAYEEANRRAIDN